MANILAITQIELHQQIISDAISASAMAVATE
jgi:hypothetical protein